MRHTSVANCQKSNDYRGNPDNKNGGDGHINGGSAAKVFDYIKAMTLHNVI